MAIYAIIYYLNEEHHECGCGDEHHDHEHNHEHHHHRDDYDVTGTIKTFGSWANIMPDTYLVKSELSANEISSKLKEVLEPSDILFVTKVDKDDVASLTPGVVEWINR